MKPIGNPARKEADAFRLLLRVIIAFAVIVGVGLLAGGLAASLLALALIGWGAWGLVSAYRAGDLRFEDSDEGEQAQAPQAPPDGD